MLKKTMRLEDLDGQSYEETFYFNLSSHEIAKMEFSEEGGLESRIKTLIESDSNEAKLKVFEIFVDLIRKSVAKRSADGRRLVKNDDIVEEFEQTGAFDILFTDLMVNPNAAVEFIKGIVPKNLETIASTNSPVETTQAVLPPSPEPQPKKAAPVVNVSEPVRSPDLFTREQLLDMLAQRSE